MLDNFQDIEELHKIIFFQTGDSVLRMSEKLNYTRPHLALLLNKKGSKEVIQELVEKIKSVYRTEILQFVSKYGRIEVSNTEDISSAEIGEELKVIGETQVALMEIVLALVSEKKGVYNKSVEILKKHGLEGIFL